MMADNDFHWYAIKVFWRRTEPLKDSLDELGVEYYAQKIVPSYMFIRSDKATALRIRNRFFGQLYLYADRKTKEPVVVPDKEMEIFRIVTSAGDTGLEFLGPDAAAYRQGDKVRVTDGPFKGAEGYIKRIKKDRRLVVSISGIAAIATSYIPPELLEKIF